MEQFRSEERILFPLSLSQQNIWSLEQACPETSINHISTTLRIHGRVDLALLQQSIELVLAADPSLRARIVLQGETPMQYHAPFTAEQFPIYDFTQTSAEGINRWEESVTREAFSLLNAPLYRFYLFRSSEQEGGLLIKLHHIISDGWSQILLCNRIGQTYLDLLAGKTPQLEPCPSYQAHVEEESKYLASSACKRDQRYWNDMLQNAGEPSVLKSLKGAALSPVGCRRSFTLPQSLNNAIYAFCAKNRVSPFSAIYLALAIYFRRIGGAQGFVIGVPVFNRTSYAFKQTSGMFVSTLPFYNELQEDWSFSQCSDHLTERWLDMLRHQRLPFSHIQELARANGMGEGRLFHIALSYQNGQMFASSDAAVSFSGRWHYSGYQMEQLCIHMSNLMDGRRYAIDYDYLTQVFSAKEIEDLHHCLMNILEEGLRFPQQPIHQLSMLGAHEREQALYLFNQTDTLLYDRDLYARFAHAAARHPGKAALICDGKRISYQELEHTAARVQSGLQAVGAPALAAVLLPRVPALHAAMLGTLRAGWAFLLLTPGQPAARLTEILRQSGAAALISDTATLTAAGLETCSLPLLDMNALPDAAALPAEVAQDAPAYVVYTSGSTGTPKGVEISRHSLLNLAAAMGPVYGPGAVLSICSVGFDAFLLESAAALLNGRTILLPEDTALESPERLAALIHSYGVGFLSTTPSRLAALLKHDAFAHAMRRMECIICGGEAFPGDLLYHLRLLTNARLYNQYGPSEATVAVSMKLLNDADAITAGCPMPNCRLYVLDPFLNPLPIGVYGDLYIGGLCVGLGYRNQPELTAESFLESPFEPGERLYRTGDTACWTADGEIVLGGRTDRQVKLRGLRVEPQEVAACLRRYPGIRQCTVIVRPYAGQEILAAYYTADTPISEAELLSYAASYLPRYMVPAAVIRLDAMPLTKNGKVDEARLPAPAPGTSGGAPTGALERTLLDIFAQVLHKNDLDPQSDYFLCGGNSLNAMEAVGLIQERTGHTVRIADLYACRTVRRLAALLGDPETPAETTGPLRPAPPMERYPLTPVQQGLYVQSHMDPTGRAYQMPGAFRLSAAPEISRLQTAFRRLIADEPLLRTAFVPEEDGIFMRVAPQADFQLSILTGSTMEDAFAPLMEPFQLDQAPLLRAGLWEKDGVWTLFINLHHIIGDGLTTPVLMERLSCYYRGGSPLLPSVSYLDYAWYLTQSEHQPEQLTYWVERLRPLPEPLELPGDFPRTHTFNYQGSHSCAVLSQPVSAACDAACAKWGVSPYMFFLAAFALLLSRLGGKSDLVVGVPAAGRSLPESQKMCGPFINTLPLRLRPAADGTVDAYLSAVRDEVNGMLDHQHAGLEEISAALELPRTLSQSPLYQVMFTQRPLDAGSFTLDGSPMTYLPISTGTAKMDLVAELYQEDGCYRVDMEFSSQLFLPETVCYFGRCFTALCGSLAKAEADTLLSALNALAPQDQLELVDIPQNTVAPFLNLPIPVQFQRQLALDPDAPAVIFHGEVTSRRGLDLRANQIANLLLRAGAQAGTRVGIALSRSTDLVAAVLAIWKVGAAYSPLLAHYPKQRMDYMIDIAGMTHVLCDKQTIAQLPQDLNTTLVPIWEDAPDTFDAAPLQETDLAEVLFTSGSTGQPKGVMLNWRSLANMAVGFRDILKQSDGPILCTTNVVFDMFNGEVVIPLSMGKTIVMADEEEMMLPWKLAEIIRRDGVTITQSTPSRVQMWLSNEAFCAAAPALDMMIYGGEVVTETLLRKAQDASHEAIQVNMYGPTEGTVYSTTCQCDWRKHINVGYPMQNNRVYLLDEQQLPVLPTAVGEVYLGGEGVSMGYISRPDLTEHAYLPDPFFPGQRMYRTGDIARQRLDGSYDFLGRRDAQVKLNGQRVELDEINGAFVSQGCGLQAATVPVRREDGSMELFTYYIPNGQVPEIDEIRRRLGEILPIYMIPTHFLPVQQMPCTPTGKISLRQLKEWAENGGTPPDATAETAAPSPAPVPEAPAAAEPQSAPGSAAWLTAVWQKALNRADIAPDRSFFEQGGTSLAALSVLSRYNNQGLVMSLAQFYKNPTIAAQAQLLCPEEAACAAPAVPSAPAPIAAAPAAVAPAVADTPTERYPRLVPELPPRTPGRKSMKTVLLTGATGFLGVHMLQALLEAGAGTVVCLTRDGDPQRLESVLAWYFGGGCAANLMTQVEVLKGDISKKSLGLSPLEYQALSGRLNAVWHCAADVRHYAADSDALMHVNLGGTQEIIKLARAAKAPLYHMSTTSVSGDRLLGRNDTAQFTENDFDIGQNWQENLYVRSKFLAEAAVLDAVREGLTARIFRLGRLVGRIGDGTFQKNAETNAFWLTLRGIHALGAIPAGMAQLPMELTPIDWCAQAAVALRNAPLTVYHLQSPTPPTAEAVSRAIVPGLELVSDEAFARLLAQAPVDTRGDLLAPLMDLWNRINTAPTTITVTSDLTCEQLRRAGFTAPIPEPERLLRGFRFPDHERLNGEGGGLT